MLRRTIVPMLGLALALTACRGGTKTEPQIGWIRNMHEVPRYDSQEPSPYFEDGRAMRPPVPNTVSVEEIEQVELNTGLTVTGDYVTTIPEAMLHLDRDGDGRPDPGVDAQQDLEAVLERGQQRFNIYCTPCHGSLGNGNGMVSQVYPGWQAASLLQDRLRHIPDGQLYATIRNGVRSMPGYQHSIPPRDRWAIVAYVRALQLAQPETATAQLDIDPAVDTDPGSSAEAVR
jgi:mono/diheme cytochrome c family protein